MKKEKRRSKKKCKKKCGSMEKGEDNLVEGGGMVI